MIISWGEEELALVGVMCSCWCSRGARTILRAGGERGGDAMMLAETDLFVAG